MHAASSTPSAEDLALLSHVIRRVTRAHHLSRDDAEDFAQSVHLRLIERDYDLFRKFAGRSSLRTYLHVAVTRLVLDWLNGTYGKWRPSAAAVRMGEPAIALDRLIDRDGHSIETAVSILADRQEDWSVARLRAIADKLPRNPRRRFVTEDALDGRGGAPFEDPVAAEDDRRTKIHVAKVLRRLLRRLPAEERQLIVQRYQNGRSVRALADQHRIDARVLYRRFEQTLRSLRRALASEGVSGPASVTLRSTAAK